jgi:isopenicillin-N N-acyltransferase-like protein
MSIPVLDLGNNPRERGRLHGDVLRFDIGQNLDTYFRRFANLGYPRDTMLSESEKWVHELERLDPEFSAELKGIAEGSGFSIPEITMLNIRYELIVGLMKQAATAGTRAGMDGCTSFAIMPECTKTHETFIGQNWDWIPGVKTMIARVHRKDKTDFICLGETGTVGGMQGVNQEGVGVAINALLSAQDGKNAYEKPFRMRVRDILNARNMHEAILAISGTKRVASMNFLIGHAEGEAIDIEAGPDREAFLYPDDGILTHSNHFCKLDIESDVARLWPNTMYRNVRMARLLRQHQPLDIDGIKALISDHFSYPHSICAHMDSNEPESLRLETRTSILISLNTRTMYVTDGPPCTNDYQRFALADAGAEQQDSKAQVVSLT